MYRVSSIVGHFGSGKTEFAVNYVLDLRKQFEKVSIIDMDIANPYFRSRERQQLMEDRGIAVHFNTYGRDISEDLPAISATVRAPLESMEYKTVVDIGGNDSGARIINQFRKYFTTDDARMLAVLNANRPDTETPQACIAMIRSIEQETGIHVDGIINNTHLLRETSPDDILRGYDVCCEVSTQIGIPVMYNTCVRELLPELLEAVRQKGIAAEVLDVPGGTDNGGKTCRPDIMYIYPLTLQMRPTWLDR